MFIERLKISLEVINKITVDIKTNKIIFFTFDNNKFESHNYIAKNQLEKNILSHFNQIFFKYIDLNTLMLVNEYKILDILTLKFNDWYIITIKLLYFLNNFGIKYNFINFENLIASDNYLNNFFSYIFKIFFYISKYWIILFNMEIIIKLPRKQINNLLSLLTLYNRNDKNIASNILLELKFKKYINNYKEYNINNFENLNELNLENYLNLNLFTIFEILSSLSENMNEYLKENKLIDKFSEPENSKILSYLELYYNNKNFFHKINKYSMKNYYDIFLIILLNKNFNLNLVYIHIDIIIYFYLDLIKEIYLKEINESHIIDLSKIFSIYYFTKNMFGMESIELKVIVLAIIYYFENLIDQITKNYEFKKNKLVESQENYEFKKNKPQENYKFKKNKLVESQENYKCKKKIIEDNYLKSDKEYIIIENILVNIKLWDTEDFNFENSKKNLIKKIMNFFKKFN